MIETFQEFRNSRRDLYVQEMPQRLYQQGKLPIGILQLLRFNLIGFESLRHSRDAQRELLGR